MNNKDYSTTAKVILELETSTRNNEEWDKNNVDKKRTFNICAYVENGFQSIHRVNIYEYSTLSYNFTYQFPETVAQMKETLSEIKKLCAHLPEGSSSKAVLLEFYNKITPSLNSTTKYVWRIEDATGDITDAIKHEADTLLADFNAARDDLNDADRD